MLTDPQRSEGISLRTFYIAIIIGVLLIAGLTFYATFSLTGAFQTLTMATDDQITLEKAAHELMDASDYLTEKVQRFTVDGDTRFLYEYFTEAFETRRRELAIEKMSGDPRRADALAQLQKAMEESVALMDREYYAMRLVIDAHGYSEYPSQLDSVALTAQDAALSPEDKMRRATRMVLDDAYYTLKDSIRADMRESLDALETLTRGTEAVANDNFYRMLVLVRAVIVLMALGTLLIVLMTLRLGINPVLNAVIRIKADRQIQESGAREFRYLARSFNRMTEKLSREKELLQEIANTDGLTGIRNRMALREDYDSFYGHEVNVMLMDLDDFKGINDTCGHEEGDRVLSETGQLLGRTFGKDRCYRYGGDEFLVIVPDESESEFVRRLDSVMQHRPLLEINGETSTVGYSVGHIHATVDQNHNLRDLFSEADHRMYQIKREKRADSAVAGKSRRAHSDEAGVKAAEYTGEEMKALLDNISGMYDLARVVDPIECRILEFGPNGKITRKDRCYGIWNAGQKCVNCTSALACRTGCHQEKAESFNDQVYHIQSNPVRLKMADGGAYDAVVELVSIEKERGNTANVNDRAAENRNHRAARYHAQHDSLTKTLNPRAFSEICREAIETREHQAWTMITSNIMDFRLINTLFGAQRGNEAIVRNAEALQRIARRGNGMCGRLAGDQFALFLPRQAYSEEALDQVAQALREEFSSGIFTFCVHFGVYDVEDPAIPVSMMCDRANIALRTIREDHQRTVAVFDATMMRESLREQEIISGFERALNEGQFRMYLQPLADAQGRFLGAEALVRWHQSDGSVTMPGSFIETLERAGLIHRLDMYIWECAVKQLKAWTGTDMENCAISVNMSAKDFYSIDVYQTLTELVDRYGVSGRRLKVEITETALLDDPVKSNAVISKLRQRGFIVEIDDFGKGYSSLSLLKDIHADVLKIDMSLLLEIETKQRSRTILQSIIDMADALGMEVVTEGIETEGQLQSLVAMGCHLFQGYYFSRPIPVEEFEAKYRKRG